MTNEQAAVFERALLVVQSEKWPEIDEPIRSAYIQLLCYRFLKKLNGKSTSILEVAAILDRDITQTLALIDAMQLLGLLSDRDEQDDKQHFTWDRLDRSDC